LINTTISCTVTNAKGTDSGNLQMLSAFVEMLEGKRRLRECYLDDYVKNVRAKAKMSLEKPEGATLSRILSIDSDPALSQAEGVYVRFFEGWEEEDLRKSKTIHLIAEVGANKPLVNVRFAFFQLLIVSDIERTTVRQKKQRKRLHSMT